MVNACAVALTLQVASSNGLDLQYTGIYLFATMWILTLSWSYMLFVRIFPLAPLMPFLMIGPLLTILASGTEEWRIYQQLLILPVLMALAGVLGFVILLKSHAERYEKVRAEDVKGESPHKGILTQATFSIGPGLVLVLILLLKLVTENDRNVAADAATAAAFGFSGLALGIAMPAWQAVNETKAVRISRYAVSTCAIILTCFAPIILDEIGFGPRAVSLGAACCAAAFLLVILNRMRKSDPAWLRAYGPPRLRNQRPFHDR